MPHDSYYSDDEAAPRKEKASSEKGDTALLPKSFLGGSTEPGDTITLRVERILDDQIEVCKESYDKESEEDAAPMPEMPMMGQSPMAGGAMPGDYE